MTDGSTWGAGFVPPPKNLLTMPGAEVRGPDTVAAFDPASLHVRPRIGPDKTYAAGGGRKTAFSFLFLLLLPFFASLPMMLYQRISLGLWFDTWQLMLVGAVFTLIMLLVVFELMFSLRARVHLGRDALNFTLPRSRATTPLLRYRRHSIPYADITGVELRREIFGSKLAPVMLQGAVLQTRTKGEVPLGFVSEANVDGAFPFPAIARDIAARAGVELTDRGSVWRGGASGILGVIAPGPRHVVTVDEVATLKRSHRRLMLVLVNTLLTLVIMGAAMDYLGQ